MITTIMSTDHKAFVELSKQQDWLESDRYEAKKLGGRDIPTTFRLLQSNFIQLCEVYNNGELIAMIALQFDNQLVYFNTNAVKHCLKSYLKWLRQFVSDYAKERSYITVWALNSYTTTNKKLKFIGFQKIKILYSKTKWVAYGR